MLTDSHVHLNATAFDADRDGVLTRARDAGVAALLNVALEADKTSLERDLALSKRFPSVRLAIGVHPHNASSWQAGDSDMLRALAALPQVAAIGETGLDYHYDRSPREIQRRCFEEMIGLAVDLKKPLVIHSREAEPDLHDILSSSGAAAEVGCVLHCFSGSRDDARRYLDLGTFISLSGIVTFPKAQTAHDVARFVPPDRLMIETDAPYLAPVPHRGKRNEPAFVAIVAEAVAALRKISVEEVARLTSDNAARLFGWKAS